MFDKYLATNPIKLFRIHFISNFDSHKKKKEVHTVPDTVGCQISSKRRRNGLRLFKYPHSYLEFPTVKDFF